MSKSKRNTPKPNMAKFYKAEWQTQLDKLSKEERESLLANLNKPDNGFRPPRVSKFDNVNSFVKSVTSAAEAAFDKAIKERAEKKSKSKSKK